MELNTVVTTSATHYNFPHSKLTAIKWRAAKIVQGRLLLKIYDLLFPLDSANSKLENDQLNNLEEFIYLSPRADFQLFWKQGTLYIVPHFLLWMFKELPTTVTTSEPI